MIYSSPYPYFRLRTNFTLSDNNGAAVIHHDLLEHSLESGVCTSAEIFLEWISTGDLGNSLEAIRQLSDKYGDNMIALRSFRSLPPGERIGVAKNVDMAIAMMTSRAALAISPYPVCLLTHSLVSTNPLHAYTGLCLGSAAGDSIVATSTAAQIWTEKMLDSTVEYLVNFGIPRSRINVPPVVKVPLATDEVEPLDRLHCRATLGIPADSIVSVWLGRFNDKSKADLEPLLLIWPQILKKHPQSRLVLAGHNQDQSYLAQLQRLAIDVGVASSLYFITNFPSFTKRIILSAADIFISPVDNIQETFGVSLIEAMMHGLPVVASEWSGYKDIVKHRETGLLIPALTCWDKMCEVNAVSPHSNPEDLGSIFSERTIIDTAALLEAILSLSESATRRHLFGSNGRLRALQLYSWPIVIQQFGDVWHSQIEDALKHRDSQVYQKYVDMVSLFESYGTRKITDNCSVDITMAGKELLGRSSGVKNDIIVALERLDNRQSSDLSCCDQPGHPTRTIMIWLLKKGFATLRKVS